MEKEEPEDEYWPVAPYRAALRLTREVLAETAARSRRGPPPAECFARAEIPFRELSTVTCRAGMLVAVSARLAARADGALGVGRFAASSQRLLPRPALP